MHKPSAARVAAKHLQLQPDYGSRCGGVDDMLLGPGWRLLSEDAKETVYANQGEGCVIRVRHQHHFRHRPVILECGNGYTADFKFVREALDAVKRGQHRSASREAFNKYNPIELLSQLLAVLEREGLDDAVRAVKAITRTVNEEWVNRER